MKNSFYTHVALSGNNILFRGIENGRRVSRKIRYSPTLFLKSQVQSKYKTIHGENLESIKFHTMSECREYVKTYEGVHNYTIYGNQKYEYCFIADTYKNEIHWDINDLLIANIDIEVGSENGFPDPATANEEITAITIKLKNHYHVFGCDEYKNSRSDVTYYKCSSEYELIEKFLRLWTRDYPDIVTGWNIRFFDFPYIINRIKKLFDENTAKKLSPWYRLNEREVVIMGRPQQTYEMCGVVALDYLELYRKFAPSGQSQESYKLNHIAHVEVGEKKISYDEYDNLHQLYKLNYQKFIDYNIHDVSLVDKIDDKLKLIELSVTLAYEAKANYDDVLAQTRMWDALIFNKLKRSNHVLPPLERHTKTHAYEGAYVKDPIIGLHKWVASFDLESLYPHLIIEYNISPETLIEPSDYDKFGISEFKRNNPVITLNHLLDEKIDTEELIKNKVTITPNNQFFKTDKQGFLGEMMETMYAERSLYKKKMIEQKKLLVDEKDSEKRIEIEKKIARFNNLQLARKIQLNSAYGALGNEFFRFYDTRQAEGITLAGQLSIKWIEQKVNSYMNGLLKTNNKDYIIAVDTDSIYLVLDDIVQRVLPNSDTQRTIRFMDKLCQNEITPFIQRSYQELADYVGAFRQAMKMKREALADKAIWTAKKRYIVNVWNDEGVELKEPKMKIMGLEAIKSSTPEVCRGKIKDVIKLIINKDNDEVIKFIDDFRKTFTSLPPEDVAFPRSVNGVTEYSDSENIFKKGTPIHVRGSLMYNHILKEKKLNKKYPLVRDGDKIKFMYLNIPNPYKSNTIAFPMRMPPEFDIENYIDYSLQFDKVFLEPLKIILNAIGWKAEETNTLESLFD